MPFDLKKQWPVALSAVKFAVSGCLSAFWWVPNGPPSTQSQWHVALLFGIPLVLLCRCRPLLLGPIWLAASGLIWWAVLPTGQVLSLLFDKFGVIITGVFGALLFGAAFCVLVRRAGLLEFELLATFGLLGGVVFASLQVVPNVSDFSGGPVGSVRGFAALAGHCFAIQLTSLTRPDQLGLE